MVIIWSDLIILVTQKGAVWIYHKEHIPLIRRDDLCTLDTCLVTEIWSSSQNQEEFLIFWTNFEIPLSQLNDESPLCSIVTGDFNARCTNWWKDDITNSADREIASLTSSAAYTQNIDKPTHLINNSMSCIDLIFCTNQNVISKHGVDDSIFDKCHHNITYGNIDICVHFPPKYVREVWDYSKADIQNIKKSIKDFNWGKTLEFLSEIQKLIF